MRQLKNIKLRNNWNGKRSKQNSWVSQKFKGVPMKYPKRKKSATGLIKSRSTEFPVVHSRSRSVVLVNPPLDGPSTYSIPDTPVIIPEDGLNTYLSDEDIEVARFEKLYGRRSSESIRLNQVDGKLPCFGCCPLQPGCIGLALIQLTWGFIHSILLTLDKVFPPVRLLWISGLRPFIHEDTALFICNLVVDLVVGSFLALYLLLGACKLHSFALRQYIWYGLIYEGVQILQYFLIIYHIIHIYKSTRNDLIVASWIGSSEMAFRTYAMISAARLKRAVDEGRAMMRD